MGELKSVGAIKQLTDDTIFWVDASASRSKTQEDSKTALVPTQGSARFDKYKSRTVMEIGEVGFIAPVI